MWRKSLQGHGCCNEGSGDGSSGEAAAEVRQVERPVGVRGDGAGGMAGSGGGAAGLKRAIWAARREVAEGGKQAPWFGGGAYRAIMHELWENGTDQVSCPECGVLLQSDGIFAPMQAWLHASSRPLSSAGEEDLREWISVDLGLNCIEGARFRTGVIMVTFKLSV